VVDSDLHCDTHSASSSAGLPCLNRNKRQQIWVFLCFSIRKDVNMHIKNLFMCVPAYMKSPACTYMCCFQLCIINGMWIQVTKINHHGFTNVS
jgi:hypothetical protein